MEDEQPLSQPRTEGPIGAGGGLAQERDNEPGQSRSSADPRLPPPALTAPRRPGPALAAHLSLQRGVRGTERRGRAGCGEASRGPRFMLWEAPPGDTQPQNILTIYVSSAR